MDNLALQNDSDSLMPSSSSHPLIDQLDESSDAEGNENPPGWTCEQVIQTQSPVYSICVLDGLIVSAGASKKISIWKKAIDGDWALHRYFIYL